MHHNKSVASQFQTAKEPEHQVAGVQVENDIMPINFSVLLSIIISQSTSIISKKIGKVIAIIRFFLNENLPLC